MTKLSTNLALLVLLASVLGMIVSATSSGILSASTDGESNDSNTDASEDNGNGNGNDNGDEGSDEPEPEPEPEPTEPEEESEPEEEAAPPSPDPSSAAAPAITEDIPVCDSDEVLNEDNECEKVHVQPVCDFDEFVNDDNECEKIPEDPVTAVLPPCDGSFQDCVTPNGDVCLAGASTHECELPNPGEEEVSPGVSFPNVDDETETQQQQQPVEPVPPIEICIPEDLDCDGEIDDQFIPDLPCPEGFMETEDGQCVSIPEPEPEPPVFNPDESCMFDPSQPKCIPSEDEDCPEGFGTNEDGQCFFRHDQGCPEGYHSHEDDESGRCIPDDVPCEPGYVRDPDYPTCNDKERVCEEHPNADICKDDDDDDDREEKTKVIVEIIKKKIVRHENIVHGKSSFPDVDIIGLTTKDNGDSMVCLMDIGSSLVQCQDFGMPNDKVDNDFSRIIEVDEQHKEYDDGGTGSSTVNDAIQAINDQDFNELEDLDNHDFNIDLAVFGINPNGDGMVCLVKDDRGFGKSLCEPFKIAENAASGQITEAVEFN